MLMFYPRRRRMDFHLADSPTEPRHRRTLRQGDVSVNHANHTYDPENFLHVIDRGKTCGSRDSLPWGCR
jgi:hypothetical protein